MPAQTYVPQILDFANKPKSGKKLELKNFSNINEINEINKIISNICDDLQKEINIIIENEKIRGDQNNIIDMLEEYEEELNEYII